jgi:integrase-like protein
VAIYYIQPGKPDQNAYIERLNRSYRTEVLNAHLFGSVAGLRALTDTWLRIYNSNGSTTASAGCHRSHSCRGLISRAVSLSSVHLTGKLT